VHLIQNDAKQHIGGDLLNEVEPRGKSICYTWKELES
jgi:hypothetical protein